MKLNEIIHGVEILSEPKNDDTQISSIHLDSRFVKSNSIFVAISGNNLDGNQYIYEAIKNGAQIIISEYAFITDNKDIDIIIVKDGRKALAQISANFYNHPSKKLKLIGITGTNGKTTTATILFDLFKKLDYKVALLSTIENRIGDKKFETKLTTPDPITLNSFLADAVSEGCTHAFMECSSHAIHQKRTFGLHFTGAIFTNLSHDHLDYHKTMEEYGNAKKELFDSLPSEAFALSNKDDSFGEFMLRDTGAKKYYYSLNKDTQSDFTGNILNQELGGLDILINSEKIKTKLLGTFNAYNILAIYGASILLNIQPKKVKNAISTIQPPQGRLDIVKSDSGIFGVIDYAHTPDALENIISTLKNIKNSASKIITVVGCGGDRDKEKRSIIGNIAYELSDYSIFTSDNSRSEDSEIILKDIVKNLPIVSDKYTCIVDRSTAIKRACGRAKSGDIILVAGKGHEQCQIFSDRTIHFSDKEELVKNFKL